MKGLKRGIAAFLLGEFFVISKKDKTFKKKLQKKTGMDKIKFLFQTLFDFNKDLIEEGAEVVKEMDISTKVEDTFEETKIWAEKEYEHIKGKIIKLEKEWKNLDKKYIKNTLEKLENEYAPLYKKIVKKGKELNKKYKLEEKLLDVKKHITKLKKKI